MSIRFKWMWLNLECLMILISISENKYNYLRFEFKKKRKKITENLAFRTLFLFLKFKLLEHDVFVSLFSKTKILHSWNIWFFFISPSPWCRKCIMCPWVVRQMHQMKCDYTVIEADHEKKLKTKKSSENYPMVNLMVIHTFW